LDELAQQIAPQEAAPQQEVNPAINQINSFLSSTNIAKELDQELLNKIGAQLKTNIDIDIESRMDWEKRNDVWMKLATQVMDNKTFPWPGASNVKFPLLATAAMQFSARAYPALVPGPNLVSAFVVGKDTSGEKQKSAERVGKHLSFQVLNEMDGWEEDMDRLTMILPIVGCAFKKTYYDSLTERNCSELIFPRNFIVEYYAKSLESAFRKTEKLEYTQNDVFERIEKGLWLDVELGQPQGTSNPETDKITGKVAPGYTDATPYTFYECHTFLDLDEDGYSEPYIVTLEESSGKVVRIVARFSADGVKTNAKGKIVRIVPDEYYTKFGFIPNPDGSIYDLGFGLLLGGINESVNTLTNQLIDAGTINNLSSGFLGRGIRIRAGNTKFLPGEWKPVDFTGEDIKKHIFPIPSKDPSEVLFKLLEALVSSGKELASVAEIFVGKMPGQNTPATTTMATIEQGLKVFTAIHKRIYRSLSQEYLKLFKLNEKHMDNTAYFTINEMDKASTEQIYKSDYDSKMLKVKPNADPNVVSQAQRLMKVQYVGQYIQLGGIDPLAYTKWALEQGEIENYQQLMRQEPPGPSPEQQAMEQEAQMKAQEHQMKMEQAKQQAGYKEREIQQKLALNQQGAALKLQTQQANDAIKERANFMKMIGSAQQSQQNVQQKAVEGRQKIEQKAEEGRLKVEQMRQQARAKPNKPQAKKAK
jgi:chaperonin GroES